MVADIAINTLLAGEQYIDGGGYCNKYNILMAEDIVIQYSPTIPIYFFGEITDLPVVSISK
jgi:hypothetical protein